MRSRRGSKPAAFAAAVALLLLPGVARANGRFPRAERLVEDPSNPDRLILAATYGVVTTSDRGGHWYHTCEAAFAGDPLYAGDPVLELVTGGTALVDVQTHVARSSDTCSWSTALGGADASGPTYDDIAVDSTGNVVVAVSTSLVDGARTVGLERSDDAGVTWHAVGNPLPLGEVMSVDLDPTDATHVVATGLSAAGDGLFVSSTDGGSTWQSSPIPGTGRSAFPYIAVVDPHAPSTIYVRTDSWILPDGAPEEVANDALFVSTDGGATWTQVLLQAAKLLGFALSPDGSTVLAGYGDPIESDYSVDATVTGIYSASTSDFQFSMVNPESVTCLTWTARGVYACLEDAAAGTLTELTLFADVAALDANSGQTLMHLSDILGPPPCCPSTDAVCIWSEVCPTLGPGACGDGGAPSLTCMDAGSQTEGDATTSPPAGVLDATAPPASGADGSVAAADAGGAHSAHGGSGGCTVGALRPGPPTRDVAAWLGAAVVAAAARRRRERRGA